MIISQEQKIRIQRYTRWSLFLFVTLLVVTNYYVFVQVLDRLIFIPLDIFLNSIGVNFSIQEPIKYLFQIVVPGAAVAAYVIDMDRGKFVILMRNLYNTISNSQLVLLSIFLPLLLFFQNKVLGEAIKLLEKDQTNQNGRN